MMGAIIMMKTLLPMTMRFPSIASLGWQESNSNRLRGTNKQPRMHHDIAMYLYLYLHLYLYLECYIFCIFIAFMIDDVFHHGHGYGNCACCTEEVI